MEGTRESVSKIGNKKTYITMKHLKFTSLLAMLTLFSCQQELQETVVAPEQDGEHIIITATAGEPGSKTAVQDGGAIWWSPSDSINVFYWKHNLGKFVSISNEEEPVTVFCSEKTFVVGSLVGGEYLYWGVYPYSVGNSCDGSSVTLSVPAEQTAVANSYDPKAFPSVGCSTTQQMAFYNVCGGVKFTINHPDIQRVVFKGNNNEVLAGSFQVGMDSDGHPTILSILDSATEVSVSAPSGEYFTPGIDYYMALSPVVLSHGFTMTFEGASGNKEYRRDGSVEVKRSIFAVLEGKDGLVMSGSNCFIISQYGPGAFDARFKGNTQEPVGEIASVEILWESFGNDVQPEVGDIVSNVSVNNGIVAFNASGKDGNAVIAVKDAAGNILWSWHIWVCQGFDPDATAQEYYNNAGIVMDRNLGATSATKGDVKALGLLYQWGRKDPFLSGQSISYSSYRGQTNAKSTISWPSTVPSNSENGTVDYVVKNPTTFVTYNSSNYDWYYTGNSSTDDTRWNSGKGIYDPCPKGWRVPDGGSNGLWAKALGMAASSNSSIWDSINMGMDFTGMFSSASEVWYPASGSLYYNYGYLYDVGYCGGYWACTPSDDDAFDLYTYRGGSMDPSSHYYRSCGQAVRCVKESAPAPEPEPEVKDLSAEGTANCYIVSEYGPCKFDATKKGHTNESVGAIASAEVLWESFGNDVQPEVGDIVSNVNVKDGIVTFTASGKDGNAVIAVKDAAGEILWSWHIWVCQGFNPDATAQEYNNNAGTVMDRNLGATSAAKGDVKALGLLYQWGRKDPFLGGQSISYGYNSNQGKARSTIIWPATVESNSSNGTIDFVVKHPTTFVKYNYNNFDWNYTGNSSADYTLWNSNKGVYDPCPNGWRVPDGGDNGLWAKSFGLSSSWEKESNWDSINHGMDFGATDKTLGYGIIWYPASGLLVGGDGSLDSVGDYGYYWFCTPSRVSYFCITRGIVVPSYTSNRAYGHSVRCVKL